MSTLIGLAILVLDIWAIVSIWGSRVSTEKKLLWTVLVVLLPFVGLIAWLVAGPRRR